MEAGHPHHHPPSHLLSVNTRESVLSDQVRVYHPRIRPLVQLQSHQVSSQQRLQRVLELLRLGVMVPPRQERRSNSLPRTDGIYEAR